MKKPEEFNKTEALMETFKEMEETLKEQALTIEKELSVLQLHKEKLQEEMQQTWEDGEFDIDRESVEKEYQNQIQEAEKDIKEKEHEQEENEVAKREHTIQEFFQKDGNIDVVTQEIEDIQKEIEAEQEEVDQFNEELKEFYMQEQTEHPLRWQEIYNEQDAIRKNIEDLNNKMTELSNLKEEVTAIDFDELRGYIAEKAEKYEVDLSEATTPKEEKDEIEALAEKYGVSEETLDGGPVEQVQRIEELAKVELPKTAVVHTPRKTVKAKPVNETPANAINEKNKPRNMVARNTVTQESVKNVKRNQITFYAKEGVYELKNRSHKGTPKVTMTLDEIAGQHDFETAKAQIDGNLSNKDIAPDYFVGYMLYKMDQEYGSKEMDNYIFALQRKSALKTDIHYQMDGVYGRKYEEEVADDLMGIANEHQSLGGVTVHKNVYTKFMENHPVVRHVIARINQLRNKYSTSKYTKLLSAGTIRRPEDVREQIQELERQAEQQYGSFVPQYSIGAQEFVKRITSAPTLTDLQKLVIKNKDNQWASKVDENYILQKIEEQKQKIIHQGQKGEPEQQENANEQTK